MKYTDEQVKEAFENAISLSDAYRRLRGWEEGVYIHGGAVDHFKKRALSIGIDLSKVYEKRRKDNEIHLQKIRINRTITKDDFIKDFLKPDGKFIITHKLKLQLFKFNIKKEQCEKCNNQGIWNNEPLSLQLDHINGNKKDNRLENLRILCPNCHSQTKTYAGKKNGR